MIYQENEIDTVIDTSFSTINVKTTLEHYVETFILNHKKSVEAHIATGVTLIDAKIELSDEEFLVFRNRLSINNAYYKKLRVIGHSAPRLKGYLDYLPNNWTTIYKLAALKPEELERFASDGFLTPRTKAKEIHNYFASSLVEKEESKDKSIEETTYIYPEDITDPRKQDLIARANKILSKHGIELAQMSPALSNRFSCTGANSSFQGGCHA